MCIRDRTESTVPVGTADKVRAEVEQELAARGVEVPFSVASNPCLLYTSC